MNTPDELLRTRELLEEFANVEAVYLSGDILELVGNHLSYILTVIDGSLWLFARSADAANDAADEMIGLLQTASDEAGWKLVRRIVLGCEYDGVEKITLPLTLGVCPAPTDEFLTEATTG